MELKLTSNAEAQRSAEDAEKKREGQLRTAIDTTGCSVYAALSRLESVFSGFSAHLCVGF
jgi:hypothetical protein